MEILVNVHVMAEKSRHASQVYVHKADISYFICKYVRCRLQQMKPAPETPAAMLNSACIETLPRVQCGQMTRSRWVALLWCCGCS